MNGWGSKKIREKSIITVGDDAYGLSQIKIRLRSPETVIYAAQICLAPVTTLGFGFAA
jgi:hypothetical protein